MALSALLHDIHTYLIISFAIMLVVLFRFGYGKLNALLEGRISSIRGLIDRLEVRKLDCQSTIKALQDEIRGMQQRTADMVVQARNEATAVLERSIAISRKVVSQREAEYAAEMRRIEEGLNAELTRRCISAVSAKVRGGLRELIDDEVFQTESIDASLSMISAMTDGGCQKGLDVI
jgi:F0F1-type ATP synthase membrane subunit b/b'